jgi:AcrR family transcriptional regulator
VSSSCSRQPAAPNPPPSGSTKASTSTGDEPEAEQSDATRSALLAAARMLFTEHGYAATSTNEIVDRARATRGALYHHFPAKYDLFRAVFEQLEAEVADQVARAALAGSDALEQLRLGCGVFLDICLDPAVQRSPSNRSPTCCSARSHKPAWSSPAPTTRAPPARRWKRPWTACSTGCARREARPGQALARTTTRFPATSSRSTKALSSS